MRAAGALSSLLGVSAHPEAVPRALSLICGGLKHAFRPVAVVAMDQRPILFHCDRQTRVVVFFFRVWLNIAGRS